MVERRSQGRVLHENQPRLEADLREEPYRAQIEYYATPQGEDNQLDDDERRDLRYSSVPEGCVRMRTRKDLDNEQLLTNSGPQCLFR